MKFNRTRNASRNIVVGFIQRLYQTLVPFAMRSAMIYWLGVEYLGLDGLFTSILSVLNLAELGVGSAMVYSMYKPIAEDDQESICALMHLYKVYYRVIGLIVLLGGLVIAPFVPRLIKGDVPSGINVYILWFLNLGSTVLSYWLFAYKNSLLYAHQRKDIVGLVSMAVYTLRYVLQFVLLFILHNYYVYLVIALASQALTNISTSMVVDRMYPQYREGGELPNEERRIINHRIRDLFTARIGSVVVDSVDTIVISAFLGLTMLAIYQNYYFIIMALLSIVNIVIYSCTAGIGNALIVETKQKNYDDFKAFLLIMSFITSFCSACLLLLFQPFMQLWVGEKLMLEYPAVICFCIYFFIVEINALLNNYKDAAGIWHEDRFRPIVTAIVNVSMNLITVQFWGIYGVLLSTVLSMMFVGMPWLIKNLFSTIFEQNMMKQFLVLLAKIVSVTTAVMIVSYYLGMCIHTTEIITMIIRVVFCGIVTTTLFYIVFHSTNEFSRGITVLDNVTKHKLGLRKLLE